MATNIYHGLSRSEASALFEAMLALNLLSCSWRRNTRAIAARLAMQDALHDLHQLKARWAFNDLQAKLAPGGKGAMLFGRWCKAA